VASAFVVCACTTTLREYPRIPAESGRPLVLLGKISGFTHLAQFRECLENKPDDDGLFAVCMDPAPFEIHIEVERTIYGSSPGAKVRAATTAHWGTQRYRPLNGTKRLFYVVTDGKSSIMPRYSSEVLQPDVNGNLAVPSWFGDDLWWLPCDIESLRKKITFANSAAKPIKDVHESILNGNADAISISGDSVMPTTGIYVSAIQDFLKKKRPTTSTMACPREDE
jgi:hypothetical protein